jgi:hypothetical protein
VFGEILASHTQYHMKKTGIKTNTVTDEHGRVRFHGAFTGGFSAGYYNTVGSEEGFKPAQFVSSRSNRATQQSQTVNDYMDEGDGLLGGKLSSKSGIDTFAGESSRPVEKDTGDLLSGRILSNITVQSNDTIGKKMLAAMGWRMGHGIGPRIANKKRSVAPRRDYFAAGSTPVEAVANETILHPGVDISLLPKSAMLPGGILTFAPEDEVNRIKFPPRKNNLYGIGFSNTAASSGGNRHNQSLLSSLDASHAEDYNTYAPGDDEDEYAAEAGFGQNVYRMSDVAAAKGKGSSALVASRAPGKRERPHGESQHPSYHKNQSSSINNSSKRPKLTSGLAFEDDEEDHVYDTTDLVLLPASSASSRGRPQSLQEVEVDERELTLYGHEPATTSVNAGMSSSSATFKEKLAAKLAKEKLATINESVDNWLAASGDLSSSSSSSNNNNVAVFGGGTGTTALDMALEEVERCPSDKRPPLPGFHLAKQARIVPPYYPPIKVPADFVPKHVFSAADTAAATAASSAAGVQATRAKNPEERSRMRAGRWGAAEDVNNNHNEGGNDATVVANGGSAAKAQAGVRVTDPQQQQPGSASIFDLIKPADRMKLQQAVHTVHGSFLPAPTVPGMVAPPLPPPEVVPPPPPPPLAPPARASLAVPAGAGSVTNDSSSMITNSTSSSNKNSSSSSSTSDRPMLTSAALLNTTFAGLSKAFKNRFTSASSTAPAGAGAAAGTGAGTGTGTTTDAAVQVVPEGSLGVAGMKTAAEYAQKVAEQQQQAGIPPGLPPQAGLQAPKFQPLGIKSRVAKSVRTTSLWAPAPLLCKRFKVQQPNIANAASSLMSSAAAAASATVSAGEPFNAGVAALDQLGSMLGMPAHMLGAPGAGAGAGAGVGVEGVVGHFGRRPDAVAEAIRAENELAAAKLLDEEAAKLDVYNQPVAPVRTAKAVFKSIFEDSDSGDSGSEDSDRDKEDDATGDDALDGSAVGWRLDSNSSRVTGPTMPLVGASSVPLVAPAVTPQAPSVTPAVPAPAIPVPAVSAVSAVSGPYTYIPTAKVVDTVAPEVIAPGTVKFVSSKSRTTLTKPDPMNSVIGNSGGKVTSIKRFRTSFEEDDDGDDKDTTGEKALKKHNSGASAEKNEDSEGEDEELDGRGVIEVEVRRKVSSVATVGGSKMTAAGRRRVGAAAAASLLRQRLRAADSEDENDEKDEKKHYHGHDQGEHNINCGSGFRPSEVAATIISTSIHQSAESNRNAADLLQESQTILGPLVVDSVTKASTATVPAPNTTAAVPVPAPISSTSVDHDYVIVPSTSSSIAAESSSNIEKTHTTKTYGTTSVQVVPSSLTQPVDNNAVSVGVMLGAHSSKESKKKKSKSHKKRDKHGKKGKKGKKEKKEKKKRHGRSKRHSLSSEESSSSSSSNDSSDSDSDSD